MRRLQTSRSRAGAQAALIIAGLLSVALGVYRDEARTVLMKAVYICLECIGIG